MIKSKSDLEYYLEEDCRVYDKRLPRSLREHLVNWLFPDSNFEFMVCLRHLEYHLNKSTGGGSFYHRMLAIYYHRRHAYWRARTGIELNPNVAGAGLHLSHGKVVIGFCAQIGTNCKINSDVTIGAHGSYSISGAPKIGNRVYIGTGAKILGNITIADDVVIGANSVVTKSITEPGTTWGGIPARKLNDKGSAPFLRLKNNEK